MGADAAPSRLATFARTVGQHQLGLRDCPLGVLDRGDDGPHLGIALIDLLFISGLPQMACRAFELGLCGASQALGDECVSLPGDFIGTGGCGHAVLGACGVGGSTCH